MACKTLEDYALRRELDIAIKICSSEPEEGLSSRETIAQNITLILDNLDDVLEK